MKVELIAKPVIYKDETGKERKFYNYFLKTDNGTYIRIAKYYQKTKDGKVFDTERELRLIAVEE